MESCGKSGEGRGGGDEKSGEGRGKGGDEKGWSWVGAPPTAAQKPRPLEPFPWGKLFTWEQ